MALLSRAFGTLTGSIPVGSATINAGSVEFVGDLHLSYEQIYRTQPWVYIAVNKLVRGISALPLKAYQRDGLERERLHDAQLAHLMRRPFPRGTPFQLKSSIIGSIGIYGNAFTVKVFNQARPGPESEPAELWPAPAVGWKLGEKGDYVWTTPAGEQLPFEPWRVIHHRFWSTDKMGFGISPIEPLRKTLAIEDAAQRLGVASFSNAARPSGVLSTEQSVKEHTIERLREDVKRLHGGVENAFKIAILENGLKWEPMSHTMHDSAVIDHRKLTREEVAAAYDIPQPAIGILDRATFSNVQEQHRMLYMDTYGPYLTMIEEFFDAQLLDGVPGFANQFIEFDLNEVMKGDARTRSLTYGTLMRAPVMTPNEARARENLPPMDDPRANQLQFPNPDNMASAPGDDDQVSENEESVGGPEAEGQE